MPKFSFLIGNRYTVRYVRQQIGDAADLFDYFVVVEDCSEPCVIAGFCFSHQAEGFATMIGDAYVVDSLGKPAAEAA